MTTTDDADSETFEAVVLLYLAVAKLPDDEFDAAEAERILELTEAHAPGLPPSYCARVIKDVSADFAATEGIDAKLAKVVVAAERVAEKLSVDAKRTLIRELHDIAGRDGAETVNEREFVIAAAKTLGVDAKG